MLPFPQVTDGMIMAASEALAASNSPEDLAKGRIYPGLSDVRSISARWGRRRYVLVRVYDSDPTMDACYDRGAALFFCGSSIWELKTSPKN